MALADMPVAFDLDDEDVDDESDYRHGD